MNTSRSSAAGRGGGRGRPPRGEDEARRARRLRRLAALEVVPWEAPVTSAAAARVKESVLRQFRSRASSVGFSDDDLSIVMDRLCVHEVRAGRFLLTPADTPPFVSVVGLGAVKTVIPLGVVEPNDLASRAEARAEGSRRGQRWLIVQLAKPGYVVGLTPISRRFASRKFGAVAHCDSVVAELGHDVIREVLGRMAAPARLMLVMYHCRALSRLIAMKCRLLPLSVPDRLRCELAQLARQFPRPGHPGLIDVELRHQDFADLVGTVRTSVVHAMRRLEGIVHFDRGTRRYVVSGAALDAATLSGPAVAGGLGLSADADERDTFRRYVPAAMRFLGLPPDTCRMLLDGADLRSFPPGQVIAADDPLHATIIVEGAARVLVRTPSGRDVGVCIARRGHLISAGSGSSAAPAFYAIAHDTGGGDSCQVAILRSELLHRAVESLLPEQILAFLGYCHDALSRHLYDRTIMLSLGNAERLLYQLHVLAADFGKPVRDGTVIDLPLSFGGDLRPLIATNASGMAHAKHDLLDSRRIDLLDDKRIVVRGLQHARSIA